MEKNGRIEKAAHIVVTRKAWEGRTEGKLAMTRAAATIARVQITTADESFTSFCFTA